MGGKTGGAGGPGGAAPSRRGLSRREHIALFLHRELDHRLSPLGVAVFRRTKGSVAKPWKVDALLLTTRGRRSGRQRTVVLQWFHDPDGEAMVVVAANDGGAADPAWFLNLVAEPRARVEIEGRPIEVRAEILSAEASDAWWPRILERSPEYERYRRATGRPFPVVRLVPIPDPGAPGGVIGEGDPGRASVDQGSP